MYEDVRGEWVVRKTSPSRKMVSYCTNGTGEDEHTIENL